MTGDGGNEAKRHMIAIDPSRQDERDNHKLLLGSVIPRPIAFVTTLSESGVLNAAPFSFFNIVTVKPPLVSIAVQRVGGRSKDTARNAMARGELVVHIADESYTAQLNMTAAAAPPEVSEVELAALTPVASEAVAVPGVAEARIRMECVLERAVPLGGTDGAPSVDLLIARVVRFHIDRALVNERGHVDAAGLKPLSRLAGASYARLGEAFELERPR